MKAKRQAVLLRVIQEHQVESQEQLLEHLRRRGIDATQATVSRDIRELGLVKIANGQSKYVYADSDGMAKGRLERRMRRVLQEVRSVSWSGSLLILKTYPGSANAVASVLDELEWPGTAGTIAGDDVVLVIVQTGEEQEQERPVGLAGSIYDRLVALMDR